LYVECVVLMVPADEIGAGRQIEVADMERDLGEEEMGIFAVGGVSGGDENDASDILAFAVGDAGGGTHFGLNAFLHNRGAGGQQSLQFRCGGGTPACARWLLRRAEQAAAGQENRDRQKSSHSDSDDYSRYTMPRCSAVVAAWVRSLTPSLPRMLLMWVLTVASEMWRSPPISLLLRPATMRFSTSSSRVVSAGPPMRPASFSATKAGIFDLPAYTARIASVSSAASIPFSRYP